MKHKEYIAYVPKEDFIKVFKPTLLKCGLGLQDTFGNAVGEVIEIKNGKVKVGFREKIFQIIFENMFSVYIKKPNRETEIAVKEARKLAKKISQAHKPNNRHTIFKKKSK